MLLVSGIGLLQQAIAQGDLVPKSQVATGLEQVSY